MPAAQTWSTDPVPEQDRFAAWTEKMQALHMDWDLSTTTEDDYAAWIRYRGTGNAQIADVRCAAFGGRHDPSAGAPDVVGIQLQLSGWMLCSYGEDRFTIQPGDLFLWASDREGTFLSDGQQRQATVIVPRVRVPESVNRMLEHGRPLAARPGSGLLSIAAGQLRGAAREMDHLTDDAVNRTVTALLDLVDGALVPVTGSAPDHRAALRAQVEDHITTRLDDRRMSVTSIAAAHQISVRTLHLVFAESGTSVGRWTRQQRLEQCRRDLAAATGSTTVTDVAFRWGFNDSAHFSRVFKQAFGVPPTAVMPRGRRQSVPAG